MVVGVSRVEIHLYGNSSLKGKRSVLKPIVLQLRRRFNVAVAEVGWNDSWQSAELAVATVSNDAGRVHTILERSVHWIESHHPEVEVVDWRMEIL
jgi:uncharacterized protein YlxP (DUF503 family)